MHWIDLRPFQNKEYNVDQLCQNIVMVQQWMTWIKTSRAKFTALSKECNKRNWSHQRRGLATDVWCVISGALYTLRSSQVPNLWICLHNVKYQIIWNQRHAFSRIAGAWKTLKLARKSLFIQSAVISKPDQFKEKFLSYCVNNNKKQCRRSKENYSSCWSMEAE